MTDTLKNYILFKLDQKIQANGGAPSTISVTEEFLKTEKAILGGEIQYLGEGADRRVHYTALDFTPFVEFLKANGLGAVRNKVKGRYVIGNNYRQLLIQHTGEEPRFIEYFFPKEKLNFPPDEG